MRTFSLHPLLPGTPGNHAKPATAFGGRLDEGRIWRAAQDGKTLAAWMARESGLDHPQRAALPAWWSFDAPPFPRPPGRPNGCFRGLPPKANS